MGDGAPRATKPPDGGDGAGNRDGSANPEGTPIALNDAHASQASKELKQASGTDLEAFLRAQISNETKADEHASNFFLNDLRATTSMKSSRGKRLKSRFSPRPYEQASNAAEFKDDAESAAPASNDAEQPENESTTTTPTTNKSNKDDPRRTKKIHLEGPPKFIVETHTLRERLALEQIQRDLLTYCLHIDTPGQLRMPAETAKYHFYTQMLAKNQTADGPTDAVVDLMTDFVRPELRDKWEGYVLPFPFGAVTLRAASYFEQEDKRDGLDQETVKLLYSCYLIGKAGLALDDVHAIAKELSGGIPLLNIEPIEPTGAKTLDPYMTKVTYNSVDAPLGIEHLQELAVRQGDATFKIGLHQPRLATRQPCSVCLGTTHFRNKCPNKDKAAEVRAPYVKDIDIPAAKEPEFEPAAADLEAFQAQMARMRAKLAPELVHSDDDTTAAEPQAASNAEPGVPKTEDDSKNRSPKPPKKSGTNAKKIQIGILLNAGKSMHGGQKKPRSHSRKEAQPVAPSAAPTAGDKRTREIADEETTASARAGMEKPPPTRQAKLSEAHKTINTAKPDAPRVRNTLAIQAHQRPPLVKGRREQLTLTPFMPKEQPAAANEQSVDASSPEVEVVGHKPASRATEKIDTILTAVRMTEVATPANGSCLKYALVAAQAYECGTAVTVQTDAVHAKRLGSKLNKRLARNVDSMIADGTLNLVSLCATVLGKVVEKNSVKQLKDHFNAAGKQPCDINIGREFWAGEPEIKTFVEWVDEPVYSIDVMEDGDAFPQWYRMADVRRPDGTSSRRAIVSAVSPASFRAHMDVYRRNQVVPLVILLHHTEVRGRATGHFTAARVSNETYKHWAGTKRLQSAMKERLAKVQRVLPFMDHDLTQYVSFPPSPPHTPGEGPVYEPSGNNSSVPENAKGSSANSAGAKDEDSPMRSSEQTNADSTSAGANRDSDSQRRDETPSPPSFTLLQGESTSASRQASSLPSSIFSILANDSQPALTPEIFPRPRHSSQFSQTLPPAGMKEEELIIQLRARPPYGDEIARQVRRTYTSNTTAFDTWRGRQRKENPPYTIVSRRPKGQSAPRNSCKNTSVPS